jgi:hypothetical protein
MRWLFPLAVGCGLLPAVGLAAEPTPPSKTTRHEVPYRLTDTKHVLVRAKLNGKGPFNLILDTGAPAVFLTKGVAKKAGIPLDEKGWGAIDSFELEGGVKIDKARTRVEDLVQIDGMNGLGLAGVELHGVIGYNVLARFRIVYDFTSDKLAFESIPGFTPPAPEKIDAKGGDDIQTMGPLVKMMSALLGIKPNFEIVPRGFVGIEFDDAGGAVVVKKVLAGSPAAAAGFKAGDVIESVKAKSIETGKDLSHALAKAGVGTTLRVTIKRGDKSEELALELGKGL